VNLFLSGLPLPEASGLNVANDEPSGSPIFHTLTGPAGGAFSLTGQGFIHHWTPRRPDHQHGQQIGSFISGQLSSY
jgi:hypothetical protein